MDRGADLYPGGFHSTKEVSKAGRQTLKPIGPFLVSIPLRKFPRLIAKIAGGQHGDVSIPLRKFPRRDSRPRYSYCIRVSIPLRKFPRRAECGRRRPRGRSFHSTKEVSKEKLKSRPSIIDLGFHSTKEVSKASLPQPLYRRKGSFHSTKEVSKGLCLDISPCPISSVSIPLRKFPRYEGRGGDGVLPGGFHSTKEVSKERK